MVVLEDYEITNVPGYGTLEAGTLVTDPAALEAALADEAQLVHVRVKNSWGTALAPPEGIAEFAGYHDIYTEYLNASLTYCTGTGSEPCSSTAPTNGLWTLVLPPSTFSNANPIAPECNTHDKCTKGVALDASCGACEAQICAADPYCCDNQWDALCVQQVQTVCGDSSCQPAPPPPPPPGQCAHDKCALGEKLAASCDPCVAQICAADSFCCQSSWDGYCVEEVASICGLSCN